MPKSAQVAQKCQKVTRVPNSAQSAQKCPECPKEPKIAQSVQKCPECPKMSKSVQTVQKCLKWPESVQSCQTSRNSILNFFGTPCTRSISLRTIPVTRWAKISLGTSGRQHCGSSVSRGLFCSASVCGILRCRGLSLILWSYMFVLCYRVYSEYKPSSSECILVLL